MYELVSPVNPRAVFKYTGHILLAFAAVLLGPTGAALILKEPEAFLFYGITAFLTALTGLFLYKGLSDSELELKEAVILAALIFPLCSIISAIPMALSTGLPYEDAFFECVSGLTTTGLSVAPPEMPPLFFFTRAWLQWVGGIGIIVLVLGVLLRPGTTAFRLYRVYLGETRIRPGVITTARLLGRVYLGLTLASFLLLRAGGMSGFDALTHALSAISTGGFSTKAESIAAYPGFLLPCLVGFSSFMGAISFSLYPDLLKNPGKLKKDPQFRYLLKLLGGGTILFALTLLSPEAPSSFFFRQLPAAAFQVVSALTTTGFSTIPLEPVSDASKFFLSILMCIGGSMGSTAGGIKLFRLIVILSLIKMVFFRFFLPREALTPLKVNGNLIEAEEIKTLTSFVLLYLGVLIASAFIFMLFGTGASDALFEVSSALATTGLSVGVTEATLPLFLKLLLCADMLLGRIEIIPLCILLLPQTWIRRT
ncbi:MAG: TrkH family potassium uptake protein [Methanosarcinaceae archaeon]|nr:TrkH family potassium uptake protein [Methanosarcinaceae archaeon]